MGNLFDSDRKLIALYSMNYYAAFTQIFFDPGNLYYNGECVRACVRACVCACVTDLSVGSRARRRLRFSEQDALTT